MATILPIVVQLKMVCWGGHEWQQAASVPLNQPAPDLHLIVRCPTCGAIPLSVMSKAGSRDDWTVWQVQAEPKSEHGECKR